MERLFLTLVNMSLSAGWIALAVALARLFMKRAPKWIHCLLWSFVALRLLIPAFPESTFSILPSARVIPQDITVAVSPAIHTGITAVNQAVNPVLTQTPGSRIEGWLSILSAIWLSGVGLMVLYSAVSWLRLRIRVRASIQLQGPVYLCDEVDTPFILGVLRPRIYLPSGLSAQQQNHVIAHEQAHLRRRDNLWKPLGFVLLALHWFNPILWLGYILLCRDIEMACDEKVIRDLDNAAKRGYSEALLSCSLHRRSVLACPLAFGEVAVKTRIKSVLNYKKPMFWMVVAAVSLSALITGCVLTDPPPCAHTYEGEVTLAATCTREGSERFTCTECWDSYDVSIAMLSHTYGESRMTKVPDCSHTGEMSADCSGCGQTHVVQTLPTNDTHQMSYNVVQEATCAVEGLGRNSCADCGHYEDAAIPCLEHSYKEGMVFLPMFGNSGTRQMVCSGCGKEQWYKIPAEECHIFGIDFPGQSYPRDLLDDVTFSKDPDPLFPIIIWDP